ncbi:hypothetical protein ACQPXT_40630 (plasmid) [Streptomyces sp. CA-100214]
MTDFHPRDHDAQSSTVRTPAGEAAARQLLNEEFSTFYKAALRPWSNS